jgi:hypothetical protein
VIGVNVNGYDSQKLKQVMAKEKLTWRSFADDGSIVGTWNLPGTPTFYIIDHQGVIRHKWVGSPSDYKLGGLPDAKAIDAALEKLIEVAESDRKREPR